MVVQVQPAVSVPVAPDAERSGSAVPVAPASAATQWPIRAMRRVGRYAITTSRAPAANCGAASPPLIVRGVGSAPWQIRLPPVAASQMPKCVTVPQFAVGAGYVIAATLSVRPPVALAALQFASPGFRCTRA